MVRPTTPATAQDALLACHARMRAFCDGLARMAALPSLDDPRVPDAAAQAERYFRGGLPLHAEDEEMTLAPLLVRATTADASLTEAVARQPAEHDRIERLAAELCEKDHASFAEAFRARRDRPA